MKLVSLMALSALLTTSNFAYADAPEVPTAAPYIVLSDNLDEPNGYGFCIDTYGPGKTDLMQTHSCKPNKEGEPRDYAGNDTRFMYNSDTGQITSYAFDGFCMQTLIASEVTVFALLECSDHSSQKFTYNDTDQTLHPAADTELCISVASETIPAGPWVKRPLALQTCEEVDDSLKQWSVAAE